MTEYEFIRDVLSAAAGRLSGGRTRLDNDVARLGGGLVVNVDALAEGVHFLPTDPLFTVGQKLARVNVSDLIAKGVHPRDGFLTLAWPETRPLDEAKALVDGLEADFRLYGIGLSGGDTISTRHDLVVSLTLMGELGEGYRVLPRDGARPGDDVWVTGVIGAGYLGLQAALNPNETGPWREALGHYRVPAIPDPALVGLLQQVASASIDVSDGLVSDVDTLAQASGVAIELSGEAVPLPVSAKDWLDRQDETGWQRLLTGGDDFQTVFCADSEHRKIIEDWSYRTGQALSRIGQVLQDGAPSIRVTRGGADVNFTVKGFQHGRVS